MTVTDQQTRALCFLAVACRPSGARQWDEHGVAAAIGKVAHLALADVALAVVRAADDRSIETPAPIGILSSSCWRERKSDRPQPREKVDSSLLCGVCSQTADRCRRLWAGDHEFERGDRKLETNPERTARMTQALRDEKQPMPEPSPRKSLDDLMPAERDPRIEAARAELRAHRMTEQDHHDEQEAA